MTPQLAAKLSVGAEAPATATPTKSTRGKAADVDGGRGRAEGDAPIEGREVEGGRGRVEPETEPTDDASRGVGNR